MPTSASSDGATITLYLENPSSGNQQLGATCVLMTNEEGNSHLCIKRVIDMVTGEPIYDLKRLPATQQVADAGNLYAWAADHKEIFLEGKVSHNNKTEY